MKKPKNKEKQRISTYVDYKLWQWIADRALEEKRTESAVIRNILEEAMEEQ